MASQRFPAHISSWPPIWEFLKIHVGEGVLATDFGVAVEEAVVNVLHHAYPPGRGGDVEIALLSKTSPFLVEVSDWGVPFNPLEVPSPRRDLSLEEREVGGLGISLFRAIFDNVTYRRDGNRNILTVTYSGKT